MVHVASRRLLRDALDARALRFTWTDLAAVPAWVSTYGRYVPLTRSTLVYTQAAGDERRASASSAPPPSLQDLALQRAREASAEADAAWPAPDRVLTRAQGFSTRIRGLGLSALERRVLTLVNGRATLREIAARGRLPEVDVRRTALTLVAVGLLSLDGRPRPVLIVEPDGEGFSEPLASLLSGRSDPVPLITLQGADDVVSIALREKPSMVILNATWTADADGTARALRSHERLAGVPLVALLDLASATREPELRAAGFDAVLVKPVPYAEIESLIGL
jgi:hypothetical protein